MKYLWAAFAAASACAQEIASPLPPDQMIAPEDKSVLDSQAKEIFREWDKVAVPVGQSVVALVAGNTQVALGTVVGPGLPAPPIDLNSYVQAKEGDVIAAVSPPGHVRGDFGVVSWPSAA